MVKVVIFSFVVSVFSPINKALYFEGGLVENDKYQIGEKSKYLNLILLKDELEEFDRGLSQPVDNAEGWLQKLRLTRSVFLSLNNVKDVLNKIQFREQPEISQLARKLKKDLQFANHFRNRGIGHLNDDLLRRSAQWSPQIFHAETQDNHIFKVIESHRSIIEVCINSYLNTDGVQKVFGKEIDLMYPPDGQEFYQYLHSLVHLALRWLTLSSEVMYESINLHSGNEIMEVAALAGQTNFNLKESPETTYKVPDNEEILSISISTLKELNVDQAVIETIQRKYKI